MDEEASQHAFRKRPHRASQGGIVESGGQTDWTSTENEKQFTENIVSIIVMKKVKVMLFS